MNPNIVEYLQLIQEPISRMSTISSIFKGFCATIVAGIAGLSYADVSTTVLILSFLPVLSFASLDVYYLMLEKKLRYLYNQVLNGEHECDFHIDLIKYRDSAEMKKAGARICDCIKSPSIWIFYPMMLGIVSIIIILRFKGVL